ncbi:MAG: hypothetical protein ACJARG_001420 [Arcticibacterium sp.]|jgi:hypothetical protein
MMKKTSLIIIFICFSIAGQAQQKVNYDENAIKPYVLPDLLKLENGVAVKNIYDWVQKRRPELVNIYTEQVFGKVPDGIPEEFEIQILEEDHSAMGGRAIRRQIALVFQENIKVNILLYLPKEVPSPPLFIGYNFKGNHTTINDPNIIVSDTWLKLNPDKNIEISRGTRNNRWPLEKVISQGFGIATIYYEDVDPDINDFSDGVHALFYKSDQNRPKDNEWGSLAGWAWGMSRVIDYVKTDKLLRNSKILAFGHSRLGKATLWAAALDDRIDLVVSNDSGCGGAAISRRKFGETVSIINTSFPHWFNTNFKQYNDKEENLPVDQHMLIALMAPRPVYIASAADDQWADPYGEYLSAYHASPVYELYGKEGFTSSVHPQTNHPVQNTIGYHMRTGRHDVTDYDWEQYMKFAKSHFNE